eukprot:TRINITY_DN16748_c0_g1_i3.p1 TRINITY_DN16748_c0_g1~~TRINITY_DN16748_c0_g1_i3.p1  ORF type:complete len:201 (-),score=53.19 TRINITY_DN16748_c0_g1_i3:29-631(-)
MPVQRLPRYEMLLKGLLQHTPENHVDFKNLSSAVQAVSKVNLYINERQVKEDKEEDYYAILQALEDKKEKILGLKSAIPLGVTGYLKVTLGQLKLSKPMQPKIRITHGKEQIEKIVPEKGINQFVNFDFIIALCDQSPPSFVLSMAVCIRPLVQMKLSIPQLKTMGFNKKVSKWKTLTFRGSGGGQADLHISIIYHQNKT